MTLLGREGQEHTCLIEHAQTKRSGPDSLCEAGGTGELVSRAADGRRAGPG